MQARSVCGLKRAPRSVCGLKRARRAVREECVHPSLLTRGAVAIGGAALLLGATLGFSQAQTASPTVTGNTRQQQRQAVLNLAATKLGLTGDQLIDALKDARKDLGLKQGLPRVGHLVKAELAVAATALGLPDVKTLRTELAGSTLTAVAQKHNVQPSAVAAAIKTDVDAKIQALVTANKLTAARAAILKPKAEARVDAFMTRQFKAARSGG
jgi:hypothetical protein